MAQLVEQRIRNAQVVGSIPTVGSIFPEMNNTTKWLVNTAAVIFITLGLKQAAPLVTQVLMIFFLAIVISPLYYLLLRLRFPSWLALTTLILAISLACFYAAGYALPRAVFSFAKDYESHIVWIEKTADEIQIWLRDKNIEVPGAFFEAATNIDRAAIAKYATQVGFYTANIFKNSLVVLFIVFFLLAELPKLSRARNISWMTEELWGRLTKIAVDVRSYMGIKTVVSAITGFLVYFGLLALGAPSAFLMGFLAFALNFVPYVGSIFAAAIAIFIALTHGGLPQGVYVAVLYSVVNFALGGVVEPKLMGRGFGVSPVLVLLSLIFWSWILGPLGTFFAVPLTMAVRVAIMSSKKEGGRG